MTETQQLGDYNIIKQIGEGPLGTVLLGEHRFMKTRAVLKVLPDELSCDRSFIQRFEEDVAKLAVLDHPHIVRIHNISFSNGQYFLVNDCIVDAESECTNLSQYMLTQGQLLEEEELFRLLSQIASALDYAHAETTAEGGIAHRGIKLNNILVGKGNEGVNLYLADYGVTRIIGSGALLTRTFKMVADALEISTAYQLGANEKALYPNPPIEPQKLSPLHASFLQNYLFLAPEQKRLGWADEVGVQADQYAFGVLAYYLLMGEFPEGIFEMPSSHEKKYNWNWDSLIQSCMQQKPDKRPNSLLLALEKIQSKSVGEMASPLDIIIKNETYAPKGEVKHPTAEAKIHQIQGQTPETLPVQRVIAAEETFKNSAESFHLKPILRSGQLERPVTDPDPAAAFHIDTTVKHYRPERREVRNIQPLLTDLAIVKGGTFYRGSNSGNRDEGPRHQITLDSFAIEIHPTTNEQFVRFLEVMGGEKDSNHLDIIRLRDSRIKRSGGKLSIESGYAKHPVVGVTWYGAIAYAKWVGKRLPTEAEWEIAAGGGLNSDCYPTGERIEKNQANFFSSDTTPVMSYLPNGYGLYDMPGNVYEWCQDWYGYNYYDTSLQEPENPKGPLQGVYRVLRGGCWKSLKEDLLCSRRHRNNPGTVNSTYGFRCAVDVQEG